MNLEFGKYIKEKVIVYMIKLFIIGYIKLGVFVLNVLRVRLVRNV